MRESTRPLQLSRCPHEDEDGTRCSILTQTSTLGSRTLCFRHATVVREHVPVSMAQLSGVRVAKNPFGPAIIGAAVAIIIVSIIAAFVQMSDDKAPTPSYTEAS